MKSEKAKKMIENGKHVLSIADKVFIHSQEGVDKHVAESAVEIAEDEMRERAIEAHFTTCLSLDGGRCKQWGFWNAPCNRECDFIKSFIKQLEKQEKP